MDVDLIVPNSDRCGEGPLWDWRRDRLIWNDNASRIVYEYDPLTRHRRTLGTHIPASGNALCGDADYIIAGSQGMFRWSPGGILKPSLQQFQGETLEFNDILADGSGRVYAGTAYWADRMQRWGKLYLIHPGGFAEVVADGFELSNGLGLSPDVRTLYFADSTARTIYAFDVDPINGRLSNQRVFVKVPGDEGIPDGLTVDAEGFVWSAQWYGGQVVRYDPDGRVERRIAMPVRQVASIMFGGPELDELYITTAAETWRSAYSPLGYDYTQSNNGGGVYRARPGVRGKKEFVAGTGAAHGK